MPAQSESQRRLMGAVLATKRGQNKHPSAKIKSISKGISTSAARDFAKKAGVPDAAFGLWLMTHDLGFRFDECKTAGDRQLQQLVKLSVDRTDRLIKEAAGHKLLIKAACKLVKRAGITKLAFLDGAQTGGSATKPAGGGFRADPRPNRNVAPPTSPDTMQTRDPARVTPQQPPRPDTSREQAAARNSSQLGAGAAAVGRRIGGTAGAVLGANYGQPSTMSGIGSQIKAVGQRAANTAGAVAGANYQKKPDNIGYINGMPINYSKGESYSKLMDPNRNTPEALGQRAAQLNVPMASGAAGSAGATGDTDGVGTPGKWTDPFGPEATAWRQRSDARAEQMAKLTPEERRTSGLLNYIPGGVRPEVTRVASGLSPTGVPLDSQASGYHQQPANLATAAPAAPTPATQLAKQVPNPVYGVTDSARQSAILRRLAPPPAPAAAAAPAATKPPAATQPMAKASSDDALLKAATGVVPTRLINRFIPVDARRNELTSDEEQQITKGKSQWLPKIIQTDAISIPSMMASPAKQSLIHALLGGAGGAAAGGFAGSFLGGHTGLGAAIGGAGLGGLMGLRKYLKQFHRNEHLEEIMRRLPVGATKRDLEGEEMVARGVEDRFGGKLGNDQMPCGPGNMPLAAGSGATGTITNIPSGTAVPDTAFEQASPASGMGNSSGIGTVATNPVT